MTNQIIFNTFFAMHLALSLLGDLRLRDGRTIELWICARFILNFRFTFENFLKKLLYHFLVTYKVFRKRLFFLLANCLIFASGRITIELYDFRKDKTKSTTFKVMRFVWYEIAQAVRAGFVENGWIFIDDKKEVAGNIL